MMGIDASPVTAQMVDLEVWRYWSDVGFVVDAVGELHLRAHRDQAIALVLLGSLPLPAARRRVHHVGQRTPATIVAADEAHRLALDPAKPAITPFCERGLLSTTALAELLLHVCLLALANLPGYRLLDQAAPVDRQ